MGEGATQARGRLSWQSRECVHASFTSDAAWCGAGVCDGRGADSPGVSTISYLLYLLLHAAQHGLARCILRAAPPGWAQPSPDLLPACLPVCLLRCIALQSLTLSSMDWSPACHAACWASALVSRPVCVALCRA